MSEQTPTSDEAGADRAPDRAPTSGPDGAPGDAKATPAADAPAAEPATPLIGIDEFAKVDLRVGVVREAGPHPNADRLLVLKVDLGEEELRQVVAGIRSDWEPEQLIGRSIIVASNLKPAKLRGVESRGMILAAKGVEKVIPLGVDGEVTPGTRVS